MQRARHAQRRQVVVVRREAEVFDHVALVAAEELLQARVAAHLEGRDEAAVAVGDCDELALGDPRLRHPRS